MARQTSRARSRKRHPVFLDARQRRGQLVKILAGISGFAILAWLTTVAMGIYFIDILPESAKIAMIREGSVAAEPIIATQSAPAVGKCASGSTDDPAPVSGVADAYVRSVTDLTTTALAQDCTRLGGVLVEALEIDVMAQTVDWLDEQWLDNALRNLKRDQPSSGIELVAALPLPPIPGGDVSALDGAGVRADIIAALTRRLLDSDAEGVCLYPRDFTFGHLEGLNALLSELKAALPEGVTTCLVSDAEGPLWRDAGLTDAVDSVVLRAFREPDRDAPPGPLAPQPWFDTLIEDAVVAIGVQKLRVALGSFGYLWIKGSDGASAVSFVEAMRLADQDDAGIAVDGASLNTRITVTMADQGQAELWLLDAVSLHNQLLTLSRFGVMGPVLWSVGHEDPAAWVLFAKGAAAAPAGLLDTVVFSNVVNHVGRGPFRKVIELPTDGQRRFAQDPETGQINGVVYDVIPRPFTVERYGSLDEKVVALTFDDGPYDPFTVEILGTLKREDVPATFFVIGANVLKYPELLRRMVDEGHEVGSHTFYHPAEGMAGAHRLRLELNAFQRLLASVTGRATYLFRSPYGRGEGPMTQAEAEEHLHFEAAGIVVAGADVVPRDWERMTAEEIVDYVLGNMTESGGQVIVMHDAGGDRSETAAALPILIERLRAKGYDFVPLASFIGLSRDEVMPVATDLLTPVDRAYFGAFSTFGRVLIWLFWVSVAVGVLRTLVVVALAFLRRRHLYADADAPATVAVLIPAYNEELVIADAIKAALASNYPDLSVIVVDDGSTDETAEVVLRAFGNDPRVQLMRQANGDKWSALNAAYAMVEAEVVVAVDADTILHPDAIRLLVGHFADPQVGAVAGTVKVGNRHGLLQKLQALEYITAQNIDRRAAERLNAMLVVPGSIGAWRIEAVRKVGLYSPETITEDADLTVSIIRAGYRVVFEERAISITNGAENLSGFMRQRLRWTFGMMQTSWKHRRAARTAKGIGFFAIPDLWLTGVVFALLAPFVDAVAAGAVVKTVIGMWQGVPLQGSNPSLWIIAGWIALPILDLLVILAAFGFDRREQVSLVFLAPLQRLVYRPLLYITVYRAVGLALAGRIAGWGKLIRLGRVERPAR